MWKQIFFSRKITNNGVTKFSTHQPSVSTNVQANIVDTVFPYIEKLATRGWSTSGGTYSFSMPLLDSSVTSSEIFSFGPIEKLVKKDAVLDIGTSYYGALEVDFKWIKIYINIL